MPGLGWYLLNTKGHVLIDLINHSWSVYSKLYLVSNNQCCLEDSLTQTYKTRARKIKRYNNMSSEAENKLVKLVWGHVHYCSPPRSTRSAEIRENINNTQYLGASKISLPTRDPWSNYYTPWSDHEGDWDSDRPAQEVHW